MRRALSAALACLLLGSAAANAESPGTAGQLLVATLRMPDPRFMRTVIYIVRHDASGAMGFVLNRPLEEVPLSRLVGPRLPEGEPVTGQVRLHYGGPVERTRGFVLHSADYARQETVRVTDRVAMTVGLETLQAIAAGRGPRQALVVLGYAGWGPGQLEAEIASGGWAVVAADEGLLFDDDYDGKWSRAMARHRLTF
jgi:putative transcriptional regulator